MMNPTTDAATARRTTAGTTSVVLERNRSRSVTGSSPHSLKGAQVGDHPPALGHWERPRVARHSAAALRDDVEELPRRERAGGVAGERRRHGTHVDADDTLPLPSPCSTRTVTDGAVDTEIPLADSDDVGAGRDLRQGGDIGHECAAQLSRRGGLTALELLARKRAGRRGAHGHNVRKWCAPRVRRR